MLKWMLHTAKLFTIALSLSIISSHSDIAVASPFENPQCEGTSSVVAPGSDSLPSQIDGGYRLDKECKTLYVNPPKVGSTSLIGLVPSANTQLCPGVKHAIVQINDNMELAGEALAEIKKRRGNGESFDTLTGITTSYSNLQNVITNLNSTLTLLVEKEGLQANLLLQLDWESLVSEYRRLNSDNFTVVALPLEAGILTYNLRSLEQGLLLVEANQSPIALEIDVPGLQLSGLENFNIAATGQDDAVVFGNSLAGFVRLSLAGACVFYDEETNSISPTARNANDQVAGESLVANYTYYFRLGTEATYKMSFNAEAIGEIVSQEVQRRNGEVSSGAIAEELFNIQQTSSFDIEIVDPRGTLDTDGLRQGFMSRVRESFAHDLLSKFAEVVSVNTLPDDQSNLDLTGFREETRTATHCRRGGFLGLSKRCSDHVYKVKIPIAQVKERVKKIIADDFLVRYSESGSELSTYIASSTAAMTVGVKTQ